MRIELDVTNAILGDRVFMFANDGFGNVVYAKHSNARKLVDMVTSFTKDEPDQDLVEDLIEALEDSLRIACAYKVKEFL